LFLFFFTVEKHMLGVKAPCFQQNEVFIFTVWSIFLDCFIAHLALEKSLSKSFSLYSWIQAVVYTQTTYIDYRYEWPTKQTRSRFVSFFYCISPCGRLIRIRGCSTKKRADYYKSCEVLDHFRLESDYINLHDILLKKMTERSFSCESNPLGSHSLRWVQNNICSSNYFKRFLDL